MTEHNRFHNVALTPPNSNRIANANLDGVVEEIRLGRLVEPNSHNLLVYDDMQSFREFYSEYAKESLTSGEILLLASQYEDVERVKRNLAFTGINVESHLSDGTLHVLDAQKGYFGTDDVEGIIKLALSLASKAEKERRRALSGVADLGSFFAFHEVERMMHYELSLPQKFEQRMQTICCYHEKDFESLTQEDGESLLAHHHKSILLKE
ncbi:MAG TPA: MEDS domain-containing protein [Nitrososphaerales archaeon]|nr:MEDS domain-containing protein [Nitrososphaerales archaeon]